MLPFYTEILKDSILISVYILTTSKLQCTVYTEIMSKMELLRCIHLEDIAVLVTYFQKSMAFILFRLGFGTEFRSEKNPRNRLGTVSVILRKKALIPRHSVFRGRANFEARNGTEWNSAEKISFRKQQQRKLTK
jgi:hypothetical protein